MLLDVQATVPGIRDLLTCSWNMIEHVLGFGAREHDPQVKDGHYLKYIIESMAQAIIQKDDSI